MKDKIRLIKPLADYPVGEYTLDEGGRTYQRKTPYCTHEIHKDIVEGMKDYFEEAEEGRERRCGKQYYYIVPVGEACLSLDGNGLEDFECFKYGNYYPTEEAAQAVSDLRKHVYKFPMCKRDNPRYILDSDYNTWVIIKDCNLSTYAPTIIYVDSTEEDRAERLRLIQDCIAKVGYLTI